MQGHDDSLQPSLHFSLFSLTFASELPFRIPLPARGGPAELSLHLSARPLLARPSAPPLYASPLRDRDGTRLGSLHREPDGEVLRFSGGLEFRLLPERIDRYLPGSRSDLAELRFLGPVLSYWFERRGETALHASSVALDRGAVAFLSHHGGGKSGLAAALVQAGASLLTDDLLVLGERDGRWGARPAYPCMRMWPDEAEHFLGASAHLPRVQEDSAKRSVAVAFGSVGGVGGFGSFHDGPVPVAGLYLATRRRETAGGVEIHPVPRGEALIELVRHSFSARLVEAAGRHPARPDRLARLVRSVPVRRLTYPSGFGRLPEVAEALLGSC
jgi:hypothetical protein